MNLSIAMQIRKLIFVVIIFLASAVAAHAQRTVLTGDAIYYVNASTGADINPGTVDLPFQHIQYAVDFVRTKLDFNGYSVKVQLQCNTAAPFAENVNVYGQVLGGDVFAIVGDTVTPTNCPVTSSNGSPVFYLRDGATVQFKGLYLYSSGPTCAALIRSEQQAVADVGNSALGNCPGGNMLDTEAGGFLNLIGPLTIWGPAANLFYYEGKSYGDLGAASVTIENGVSFRNAVIEVASGAVAESRAGKLTFSGPGLSGMAEDLQYYIATNGVLNTQGTTWPGSGSYVGSGGQAFP